MKTTAVDKAYAWLYERIMDGTFPGGTFIDEVIVCEAAGLSRTPVREAFIRLEGERYLSLVPRRGAQVRELSSADMSDAFATRFILESHAIRQFCARSQKVPAEMRANLRLMEELSDLDNTDSVIRYLAADREFHTAYVHSLGNRIVNDIYDSLWRMHEWSAATQAGRMRSGAYRELNRCQHRAILTALEERDASTAVKVLNEHLRPFDEVPVFLD